MTTAMICTERFNALRKKRCARNYRCEMKCDTTEHGITLHMFTILGKHAWSENVHGVPDDLFIITYTPLSHRRKNLLRFQLKDSVVEDNDIFCGTLHSENGIPCYLIYEKCTGCLSLTIQANASEANYSDIMLLMRSFDLL